MSRHYPVISHRVLDGAPPPAPEPGRTRVFRLDDGRHVLSDAAAPGTPVVAVTEIDMSEQVDVRVHTRLRERRLSLGTPIRVVLRCSVFDPVEVAQTRTSLAVAQLHEHLTGAVLVIAKATRRGPGFDDRLRQMLATRLYPPPARHAVPGMRIEVLEVSTGFADRPRRSRAAGAAGSSAGLTESARQAGTYYGDGSYGGSGHHGSGHHGSSGYSDSGSSDSSGGGGGGGSW
ncbi:hypothetical protein [Kineosporia succinea]|uniref:TIGR04222 domain-containing membrane protein n=1 Tax=Kineosporia succinea TaxID=84632 RepID=A0ABT9NXA9_9ACTN|nr:hypothetical protein [Kineosporia succinea]MDP9824956.1 hypothetical protein [Kineosporia succinea]